jgi:hypothetical protein
MKISILFFLFALSSLGLKSQYDVAIGLKVNHYKAAINYKMFLSDSTNTLLDLELGFQETGFEFIGLYNWQVPITGAKGLYWYYGVGFNTGLWDGLVRDINVGIDGQVGIEFVPIDIPIAFSLDYTPNFSLKNSYSKEYDRSSWGKGFWVQNWTLGIKYIIGRKTP